MGVLRMTAGLHEEVRGHLFGGAGERFAFFLCDVSWSLQQPVFSAREALMVDDLDVELGVDGWQISDLALDRVVNTAVRSRLALVEAHNHGGVTPRFSRTDELGLLPVSEFMIESLGRPYGATVWGDDAVYGEWFAGAAEGPRRGVLRSITAVGAGQLLEVVSRRDDTSDPPAAVIRQVPLFGSSGQRRVGRLRAGFVGCSGTGSHAVTQAARLGVRDFVLVDPDVVEDLNLNRVVTATPADVGTPKVVAARRAVREIQPGASVVALETGVDDAHVLDALRGCDVVFGCVDNDGARLVINRLALAYGVPYIDLASGVDVEKGRVVSAGGRVVVVLPGGPCLLCVGEIDVDEARFFLASQTAREEALGLGYGRGWDDPSPSVVSLNATVAGAAMTEFGMLVSGLRPPAVHSEFDVLGAGHAGPSATTYRTSRLHGCPECAYEAAGDDNDLDALLRDLRNQ